jgi:hypothetical protein
MISGLVAAVAVMVAAPAMACGYTACGPSPLYVSPAPAYGYSGCNPCGGWAHERLPDPVHQYYYVNQGPTYTGPGNWAPRQTYQESALPVYGYHRHYHASRYAPHHYGRHVLRRYY